MGFQYLLELICPTIEGKYYIISYMILFSFPFLVLTLCLNVVSILHRMFGL